MDSQELIEKYLTGRLSVGEEEEFNVMRESDDEFKEELLFHEDLAKITFEDERIRLKKTLSNRKQTLKVDKRKLRIIVWLSIAVIMTIASIVIYQLEKSSKSPEGIYAAYFEPYPNTYRPVSRNVITDAETQAFTAYENENYQLAADKFEQRLNEIQDPAVIFYQGIAYSKLENFEQAINNLEQLKNFDFSYAAEVQWYLALFFLKQADLTNAKQHLNKFIEMSDNEEKIQDAKTILEKIE